MKTAVFLCILSASATVSLLCSGSLTDMESSIIGGRDLQVQGDTEARDIVGEFEAPSGFSYDKAKDSSLEASEECSIAFAD